ncbi:hypothetical protein FIBSPDRAFT_770814, partial [Athelia psychrophila]
GHHYHIYPQPNLPSADLYNQILDWLDCYELLTDNYIFPLLHINGVIEPHQMITSDMAQKIITDSATAAGLPAAYLFMTHCFRRGGAQYRFMFAPIGE